MSRILLLESHYLKTLVMTASTCSLSFFSVTLTSLWLASKLTVISPFMSGLIVLFFVSGSMLFTRYLLSDLKSNCWFWMFLSNLILGLLGKITDVEDLLEDFAEGISSDFDNAEAKNFWNCLCDNFNFLLMWSLTLALCMDFLRAFDRRLSPSFSFDFSIFFSSEDLDFDLDLKKECLLAVCFPMQKRACRTLLFSLLAAISKSSSV